MGYGVMQQLGIDLTTNGLDPSGVNNRFDFMDGVGLVLDEEFIDTNGLRGTLAHDGSREAVNLRSVGGTLRMQPNIGELSLLLPWMLGGTTSSPFTLAETRPLRNVNIDRIESRYTYLNVAVDSWTMRASKGEVLSLELNCVGRDEVKSGTTFTSANPLDVASGPFLFYQLVMTIGGTAYPLTDFELHCDHRIDRGRFFNSQTLTAQNPTDRVFTLRTAIPNATAPFTGGASGDALYGTLSAGGAQFVATFTAGAHALTMTMPQVSFPRKSPRAQGRNEIFMPVEGQLFKNSGNPEITTTLS